MRRFVGNLTSLGISLLWLTACWPISSPTPTEAVAETASPSNTSTLSSPQTRAPTPPTVTTQPLIDLPREPVPGQALEDYHAIVELVYPSRDPIDLSLHLGDTGAIISRLARSEPWGFELGDSYTFWVLNWDTNSYSQSTARLVYKTPHSYIFVQDDMILDEVALVSLADKFENRIYPGNRRIFGPEWNPGVDSDPRLTILFTGGIGSYVSGYQNIQDEYPQQVYPFSNQMEIYYINAEIVDERDPALECTLAHEFQHMIHWAQDPTEEVWLVEGLSELACPLNGLESPFRDRTVSEFARSPDIQLNTWNSDPKNAYAQYGASTLFVSYMDDRFGSGFIHSLVAEPKDGIQGVEAQLAMIGSELTFDELFAHWTAANYLQNPNLERGRFGYSRLEPSSVKPQITYQADMPPIEQQTQVAQFGADYIRLRGPGQFQVDFTGATLVHLAPLSARSGDHLWWSGRGTNSDTSLTRSFDLSGVDSATLHFAAWYDISSDYDYAYVMVSTDGEFWTSLPAVSTTDRSPTGINFGNGYTGESQGWLSEQVDLTPYTGGQIQVQFKYLTADGPIKDGFFLDDIKIPELGYLADGELDDGGWNAQGFVRTGLALPQTWIVQVIRETPSETTVQRLELAEDNTGRWGLELTEEETAVLVISGATRVTTQPAEYWYRIATVNAQE